MELRLQRLWLHDDNTQGVFYVDGTQKYFSLERSLHDPTHPAVPEGRFEIVPYPSPHFEMVVPMLKDVPNRTNIEIHPANVASELLGCIALGMTRPNDEMILQSRDACKDFYAKCTACWDTQEPIWLTIIGPNEDLQWPNS